MRVAARTHQGVNLDAVAAHHLDGIGDDADRRDDVEAPRSIPVTDTATGQHDSGRNRESRKPDRCRGLQAQRRQTCATRNVTTRPITTGNMVATVVHLALPVSL